MSRLNVWTGFTETKKVMDAFWLTLVADAYPLICWVTSSATSDPSFHALEPACWFSATTGFAAAATLAGTPAQITATTDVVSNPDARRRRYVMDTRQAPVWAPMTGLRGVCQEVLNQRAAAPMGHCARRTPRIPPSHQNHYCIGRI